MPMMLPPPTPPVLVAMAQVPRGAAVVRASKGPVRVQLLGFDGVTAQDLQALLNRSANMEQVVLALRDRQYQRGDLSSRLAYAVDRNDVYIWSIERPIRRVVGDAEFGRYFGEVTDSRTFDLGEFERSRVLASAHADRVALTVQPRFLESAGSWVDLDLRATPTPDAQRSAVNLEISNHGSRYSGENIVGLNLRHATHGGNELAVGGRTSPSWLNDNEEESDFYELSGAFSRIAASGMYGLSLRRIGFTATQSGFVLDGSLNEAAIESSHVVAASMSSRSLLRLKLGLSDRSTELKQTGDEIFAEQYATFELNPSYSQSIGTALRIDAVVTLLYANALEDTLNSLAADSFYTARPLLKAEWTQSPTAILSLTGVYQYASDVVSELQQWTLGGPGSLSAYEPAALVGDTGYVLRLNQNLHWSGKSGRKLALDFFIERGLAEPHEDSPRAPARAEAADLGASLQLSWRNRFQLSVGSAVPLSDSGLADGTRSDAYARMGLSF